MTAEHKNTIKKTALLKEIGMTDPTFGRLMRFIQAEDPPAPEKAPNGEYLIEDVPRIVQHRDEFRKRKL